MKMFGMFASQILNTTWFSIYFDFHLNYYIDGKLETKYRMAPC